MHYNAQRTIILIILKWITLEDSIHYYLIYIFLCILFEMQAVTKSFLFFTKQKSLIKFNFAIFPILSFPSMCVLSTSSMNISINWYWLTDTILSKTEKEEKLTNYQSLIVLHHKFCCGENLIGFITDKLTYQTKCTRLKYISCSVYFFGLRNFSSIIFVIDVLKSKFRNSSIRK